MKDTKINCRVADCHWNIGIDEKDNCCCPEVDIARDYVCQSAVTKIEAKRRMEAAIKRGGELKGGATDERC